MLLLLLLLGWSVSTTIYSSGYCRRPKRLHRRHSVAEQLSGQAQRGRSGARHQSPNRHGTVRCYRLHARLASGRSLLIY